LRHIKCDEWTDRQSQQQYANFLTFCSMYAEVYYKVYIQFKSTNVSDSLLRIGQWKNLQLYVDLNMHSPMYKNIGFSYFFWREK